jgi:homoserine dehydrogenase
MREINTVNPVRVGICGLGTVGSGTFNVLTRNRDVIAGHAGSEIIIEQIGSIVMSAPWP